MLSTVDAIVLAQMEQPGSDERTSLDGLARRARNNRAEGLGASHMWIIIFPFRPLSQRAAISHVMPPSWVWSSTDLRNVGNSLKLRKLGNPGRKIIQHRLFDRHTAEPVRGQATNRPQALTSIDSFNRTGTKHEDETNPAVSRPPTANTETGMQRQHY